MEAQLGRNRPLDPEHYYHRSQRPLQALILLLPFLLIYEVGALYFTQHILARSLVDRALDIFGAAGVYMPGLMLVGVLLAWHIVKRDPWELDWRLYLGMVAESVALAIPLLMFALIWGRQSVGALQMLAGNGTAHTWQAELVFALGAGIYEGLVFRLMAIALLHMVLSDLIGVRSSTAAILAVACAAVLFASYHFNVGNPFNWTKFFFYTLAGIYLGTLFVLRGFGIVAATHAFYDILYVAMNHGFLPRE